jgi:predicted ATPase
MELRLKSVSCGQYPLFRDRVGRCDFQLLSIDDMITALSISNFKSWQQTGDIRLGKLTGFFGTNSSGKTSILQFLLVLKQTVETPDRSRVFHTGNEFTYVDIGTFYDIIYGHNEEQSTIDFTIAWELPQPLEIRDPQSANNEIVGVYNGIELRASIERRGNSIEVRRFSYRLGDLRFGMERQKDGYKLLHEGYEAKRALGRKWPLPSPVKSYGFPDQALAYYQNVGFLPDLVLAFEELMGSIYYLGPLREYPSRSYLWSGERPTGVGRRGEQAIPALLASREQGKTIQPGGKKGAHKKSLEEYVAQWLQHLNVIHDFKLQQVAPNRKEYEVRVRVRPNAPEVLITDVGFGVSQVLPVIVLCFYAPRGSTLIFEQPEIHLHPSVQAGLADVFVDAIKTQGIQIVLESHSEHLLHRLQRRIAEEAITSDSITLYFVDATDGQSTLFPLDIDAFGNIRNWPQGFFGDVMEDLSAMAEAAVKRMKADDV